MKRFVDSGEIAGISTMVARRGRTVHSATYGQRDREAGLPMTEDTIFRIYSMTKPIVSTALMMLHEEALFQLNHPVSKYLPAFGSVTVMEADGSLVPPRRAMLISDLLTHTSGLTYGFLEDSPVSALYLENRLMHDATRSLEEVIDLLATMPLAFHPGSRWQYSVGIDVAARLIEVISGQPLRQFLSERVFEPLGMVDTDFGVPDENLDRLAAMYGLPDLVGADYSGTNLIEAALAGFNERIDVSATYPTGAPDVFNRGGLGLFSTTGDMMRFGQMLLNGGELDDVRVIGPRTLSLMHRNYLPDDLLPWEILGEPNPGLGFGLGSRVLMDVAATGGHGSVGEFGWAGAAKTYFWVDPVEELVGVFMSQYMTGVQRPEVDLRSVVYQAIID